MEMKKTETLGWRICHVAGMIVTLVGIIVEIYVAMLFVSSFSLLPDPSTPRPSPSDNGPPEEPRPTPPDFCQDKNLLGVIRFGHNSSHVTKGKISSRLVDQLTNLNKDNFVLVEGYASPEGDVLHNLKLSEERAAEVIQYLRCKYPGLSSVHFRPLAKGENYPESEPNQKNCCDRQVRLFLCGSALSSTSNAPAEEPDCVCEDAECKSDLDDDSPCAEVDSACAEYENLDCQRQNRI